MKKQTTNHITTIWTEKFKTTVIKVSFSGPLRRENITERIMLANVLRNSSEKFQTKKALSAHLEDLYGATLSVSAKKQGKLHHINFYIQVANEKFLKSAPSLFEAALETLSEVIMKPKITKNAFDPQVVALEKRLLKEDIESIYDDKTMYGLKTMVALMCEAENFGVNGDGYIEDLAAIDGEVLANAYTSMLETNELDVVVLGDVVHDDVVGLFEEKFNLKRQFRKQLQAVDHEEATVDSVRSKKETQFVNQTKLNIGYRTFTRITDDDYFAMLVLNGVFGAFAHSKLFVNVREKESLCYYCGSQLDNFKGLMYVYSGLDLAQVPKAIQIIDEQLEAICMKDVTADELMMAKKSIINSKRESLDSSSGMMSDLEISGMIGLNADDFIEKIAAVTVEDLMMVAKKIKKDTIFTLEPAESEEMTNGN